MDSSSLHCLQGYVYNAGGSLSANQDLGLKVSTPVGTLFGQLIFGYLADVYGRKKMYGIELMIIIIGESRIVYVVERS